MVTLTRPITAEDFMEIANSPEYADCRVELDEGRIITMSKPNVEHGKIAAEIHLEVGMHAKTNNLGHTLISDTAFTLARSDYGGDTVRGIDVAFVSYAKLPGLPPKTSFEGAPDLAVEVISPSNTASDIRRKVRQLLRAGCRMVWVLYPDDREVDVHTAASSITLFEGDTLTGGDVLPGFELAVADIFPR